MSDPETDRNVECAKALGLHPFIHQVYGRDGLEDEWVLELDLTGGNRGILPDYARDDSWVLRMMHEYKLVYHWIDVVEPDGMEVLTYQLTRTRCRPTPMGRGATIGEAVREWVINYVRAGGKIK